MQTEQKIVKDLKREMFQGEKRNKAFHEAVAALAKTTVSVKIEEEVFGEAALEKTMCVACWENICVPFCFFEQCPNVGFKCTTCAEGNLCSLCLKKVQKKGVCPMCRAPKEEVATRTRSGRVSRLFHL